ncbi:DUF6020 family protein [Bacillus songklensis]|uniref:DUF6020 family protein n=1 Tax=Bacillus songklensis TaxID=1069116 RepID=UPI00367295F1
MASFYPALMTNDSFAQLMQIESGKFSDWHPVFHTWLIMLIRMIWDSPAAVAIVQILALALIWGYGMYCLEAKGVSRHIIWVVTLLFALSPVNGILSISLWKDTLYSSFLLLFCICIFNLVTTEGKWLKSMPHTVLFTVAILGTIFFRHNGFPVFIVTMFFLIWVYLKKTKSLLLLALTVACFYLVFTRPVYHYLQVKPSSASEALAIPMQQFAMVINENGKLKESQTNYLQTIMPLSLWKENYNPYWVDKLKFAKEYNPDAMLENPEKFLKMWGGIGLQNPDLYIKAFLKQTSIVWQIPQEGYTFYFVTNTVPNQFGVENKSLNKNLTEMLNSVLVYTRDHMKEMIWRPATYNILTLFFMFIGFLRNGWKMWLVILPIVLNTGVIMAAIPAQDFRYLFANTLIAYFALLVAFVKDKKEEDAA